MNNLRNNFYLGNKEREVSGIECNFRKLIKLTRIGNMGRYIPNCLNYKSNKSIEKQKTHGVKTMGSNCKLAIAKKLHQGTWGSEEISPP